jgi:D-glycero-alpha-D-manno-heptose-7-phosphate kinase
LRRIIFHPDDTTEVVRVPIEPDTERRLSESLLLFYTGKTRKADKILAVQKDNIPEHMSNLISMKNQVAEIEECLQQDNLNKFGRVLCSGWEMKKQLADGITSGELDELYERALDAGAAGGKITGAGGGGFLMLLCSPDRQARVREALNGLRELHISLERDGTKVIFNNRRT